MGRQTMLSTIMFLFITMSWLPYSTFSYNDDADGQYNSTTSPLETISHLRKISMHTVQVYTSSGPLLSSSRFVISVTRCGAKGDGKSDDTKAFEKAWKIACLTKKQVSIIEVPRNKKFLVRPITFSGPCKSSITLKVYGTILASAEISDYEKDSREWIVFEKISNFRVLGGGTFDGNGAVWWKNSCKIDKSKPCKGAPTAVTFSECRHLRVQKLLFKNAQQMTVNFARCHGVSATSLMVNSPEWSPNTDGIHITSSKNVHVSNSVIKTGDDCISIESGSENIRASNIFCGPGHGISIGSLGDNNSHATVSNVHVRRATLTGTTNGVRIKTWQGGSGYARNIKFEDITMNNVNNPIIIDQNYCDKDEPCKEQSKAVQVENVTFSNIRGTSASKEAITIDCSSTHKCKGIILQNISLKTIEGDEDVTGMCQNAEVRPGVRVSPRCGT